MESRVKLAGHAVHPMLIVFPLGLLITAVVFDVIYLVTDGTRWAEVAYYLVGAGVVGGLAAAVPGWIDWVAIPSGTRAKRVGLLHGVGNVVLLVLFALSWFLRRPNPSLPPPRQSWPVSWGSFWGRRRRGWVGSWSTASALGWTTERTWTRRARSRRSRRWRGRGPGTGGATRSRPTPGWIAGSPARGADAPTRILRAFLLADDPRNDDLSEG